MNQSACVRATCLGHALSVGSAGFGVVHSVFARAVNVTVRGDLWTVLTEDRVDLPLGIRVPLSNIETFSLCPGDPVHVRAGFIGVGSRLVIDCRLTPRWVPRHPSKPRPGLDRRLAVLAAAIRGKSWHESARMAHALRTAVKAPTALAKVVAQVVGRGPGATPSGDDVIVGALAVLSCPHSGVTGARAAASLGRAFLPLLPTTTDLSAHLLRQAARGLFGRDVQELVAVLIEPLSPQALGDKVRRVLAMGATSGADVCEGILAFASSHFTTKNQRGFP